MRTTFISSAALWNSPRSSLDKLQTELVKSNKELVTGRHADVGLQLGYKTGQALSLRQQRAELETLSDSNASVLVRLKTTTTALSQIRTIADKFKDSLIGTPMNEGSVAILKDQAAANLKGLISSLNLDVSGQYIFGGINTKDLPAKDYFDEVVASEAKTRLDKVFFKEFSKTQGDPTISEITPDEMEAFLNGRFEKLFNDDGWERWSDASGQNLRSLISPTERIETSANANEIAFRELTKAYTMAFDLGISNLREDTREVLITRVLQTLSSAIAGLTEMEAGIGIAQEKVEKANERMSLQKTIYDEKIVQLEAVDTAEAKVRIDQLTTQIQTSYSLTAQLRQLSLINYL